MKARSPLLGYNHNIRYNGRLFHVQTEDSGVNNPHVFTHLFHEGTILASKRSNYDPTHDDGSVQKIMQAQHKGMLKDLRDGQFDEKIAVFFGERRPALEASSAASTVASGPAASGVAAAGSAALLTAPVTRVDPIELASTMLAQPPAILPIDVALGDEEEITEVNAHAQAASAPAQQLAAELTLPTNLAEASRPAPRPSAPEKYPSQDTIPVPRLESLSDLTRPTLLPPSRPGVRPPPPPSAPSLTPPPRAPSSLIPPPRPASSQIPPPRTPSPLIAPLPPAARPIARPPLPAAISAGPPPLIAPVRPPSVEIQIDIDGQPMTTSPRTAFDLPPPSVPRSAFDLPPPGASRHGAPELRFTPPRVSAVPRKPQSVIVPRQAIIVGGAAGIAGVGGAGGAAPQRRGSTQSAVAAVPPAASRLHPAAPPSPGIDNIFGDDPFADKSLDEVILAYLSEDPPEK